MRILPPRASLDHLRRQAKELARELRREESVLRLSAAQDRVAAQYGFLNWKALKREVERRRLLLDQLRGSRIQIPPSAS